MGSLSQVPDPRLDYQEQRIGHKVPYSNRQDLLRRMLLGELLWLTKHGVSLFYRVSVGVARLHYHRLSLEATWSTQKRSDHQLA